MAYRGTQVARRALHAIAARQGGYVTTTQAGKAGYDSPHLAYHVAAGTLERVEHGLYRLPEVPPDEHDDLIRLALWSRGRGGEPRAVVSHDTALALHELSDVLPGEVHLTVPPRFRKPAPEGCVLHVGRLGAEDLQQWIVFSVTSPARTLLDAAHSGTVTDEQFDHAVAQALQRGLARRAELESTAEADDDGRLARALTRATSGARHG